jgi:hypothetical protein
MPEVATALLALAAICPFHYGWLLGRRSSEERCFCGIPTFVGYAEGFFDKWEKKEKRGRRGSAVA